MVLPLPHHKPHPSPQLALTTSNPSTPLLTPNLLFSNVYYNAKRAAGHLRSVPPPQRHLNNQPARGLPVARDKGTALHGDVSLVLGTTGAAGGNVGVGVLPLGKLGLALGIALLHLLRGVEVLVGLERRTDLDGLLAVGVKLEQQVEGSAQRQAEEQRHPLRIGLGKR